MDIAFVLTLRHEEWESLPRLTREHSINLGPVTVAQLPNLYASCNVAFFPSLFEAFSVTPLEAMVTGTPLVASDRDFVREVAGEAAWYADPTDPEALADALVAAASSPGGRRTRIGVARARAWPDARSRAMSYLELIDNAL